ncbi:MAG TPA: protease inhibitor I42 family protein [Sedimentisphaerales bacterium]|jgi:predicted secreted protein|nr:protease inhibitor I42 family protein [Sedimentisphaerales bacterium]
MVTLCTSWAYVAAVLLLTGVSTAAAKYSGGTGEPNDPYQIATVADLIALGETPADYDKHFIMVADIDLDPNLPGNKVFDRAVIAPDVNDDVLDWDQNPFDGTPFTGAFDGNGHTISHLTIRGNAYLGLFGQSGGLPWCPPGVEIKNLELAHVDIVGSGRFVGGLVGNADGGTGTVTHCCSAGMVSGGDYVGGLVGSSKGILTYCYSNGAVGGHDFVGGIVGCTSVRGGHIACSQSSVSVTGDSCVGGLVGVNDGIGDCYCSIVGSFSTGVVCGNWLVGGLVGANWGSLTQCYSTADVYGDWEVGGLAGENDCVVAECYSVGAVSGNSDVGALIGSDYSPEGGWGSEIACFWDTQTSGTLAGVGEVDPDPNGVIGKTTAEMRMARTFLDAGWDFVGETANGTEDIWKIAEGLDYPRLWWEPYDGRVTVVLGQVFTVTLESNPSTGYRWEWVDHQDSIVEQMGEAQFKPRETGDPPLVGAGGWESFDFKAVHPGQMTLKLVYRRPWEEGVEPLKTFSLQVTVP